MTDRERHPLRGVVLLAVAAMLSIAVAQQFHVNDGWDIVWLVTVVPALIIAVIGTVACGFFDLYGRRPSKAHDARSTREDDR